MIKTQFNVFVQILRTDNETEFFTRYLTTSIDNRTEFFNLILDNFLINNDLIHQSSCFNTPQQIEIPERKNHHYWK